jgi:hypothetical protein
VTAAVVIDGAVIASYLLSDGWWNGVAARLGERSHVG